MWPYLTTLVLLIVVPELFRLFKKIPPNKVNVLISIFCFSLIFLLFSLKSVNVGIDSPMYEYLYKSTASKPWGSIFSLKKEFGFYSLMKLFSIFRAPYYAFQFIYYLLLMVPYVFFSSKYCKYPEVASITFFCFDIFSFYGSALRQSGAISLILLASYFFLKNPKSFKSYLIFYSLGFVAFTFHHSALIGFFLPFLFREKLDLKKFCFLILPFYGLSFLLLPSFYETFYSFALASDDYSGYSFQMQNLPRMSLILFCLSSLFLLVTQTQIVYRLIPAFNKRCSASFCRFSVAPLEQKERYFLPCIFLASFLMQTTIVSSVGMRLAYYFLFFLGPLFSSFLECYADDRGVRIFKFSFYIFLIVFFCYTFLLKDPLSEVPYEFI